MNDNSIVIKVEYKNNAFLFTGDAEEEAENDMIKAGSDLTADVLKVGHHGSRTSTSDKWLDAVNPEIAVISAGKDNKYGHPSKEVLDRLKQKNVQILRTDESGTIILTSDGEKIQQK